MQIVPAILPKNIEDIRQKLARVHGHFGQRRLGDLQVQLDQLLDAFEGLRGQAEQGLEVGLVGGGELFRGQIGHEETPCERVD